MECRCARNGRRRSARWLRPRSAPATPAARRHGSDRHLTSRRPRIQHLRESKLRQAIGAVLLPVFLDEHIENPADGPTSDGPPALPQAHHSRGRLPALIRRRQPSWKSRRRIRLLLRRDGGRGTSGVASGRQSRRDERGDQHGGALRGDPTSEPGRRGLTGGQREHRCRRGIQRRTGAAIHARGPCRRVGRAGARPDRHTRQGSRHLEGAHMGGGVGRRARRRARAARPRDRAR